MMNCLCALLLLKSCSLFSDLKHFRCLSDDYAFRHDMFRRSHRNIVFRNLNVAHGAVFCHQTSPSRPQWTTIPFGAQSTAQPRTQSETGGRGTETHKFLPMPKMTRLRRECTAKSMLWFWVCDHGLSNFSTVFGQRRYFLHRLLRLKGLCAGFSKTKEPSS
jgi:hypothetical protein